MDLAFRPADSDCDWELLCEVDSSKYTRVWEDSRNAYRVEFKEPIDLTNFPILMNYWVDLQNSTPDVRFISLGVEVREYVDGNTSICNGYLDLNEQTGKFNFRYYRRDLVDNPYNIYKEMQ